MGNWPSRFFTQQAVKEDMLPIHIVEANLDVLSSALNHELGSGPLRCWADPSRVERESEAILPREPYLVLHLGTGGSNPPLPPTAYAAIAEGLSRRSGLRLVITGDSKLAETLEGSNHLSLAGTTSLLGLAGVLQHAKALVSVDSGPVHLAASLHTPIVVVYAKKVATPRRYHPWQATYSAIRAEAFCEGCTEAACQSQRTWTCADSVDPEKVVAAALTLLHTERLPDISAASIAEQRSDKSA
jgi:ADP-heptose:LPS heptosyltransferase